MNPYVAMMALLLLAGCGTDTPEGSAYTFFVGTYTDGESQGIYRYLLQSDGGLKRLGLAAVTENPSFLARSADGRFLVVVNEVNENNTGRVESYLIAGDSLEWISKSASGGAHPCHVTVNEEGYVLTSNYTGGNVGLLRLDALGVLSPLLDVEQHSGRGTTPRQEAPHAHSAWFEPEGNGVISVDLGTDQLWFSRLDPELQRLQPSEPRTLAMASGAGPRHLAFHPNGQWIYVVNELNGTVALVQKQGSGHYATTFTIPTLPADFTEANTCADIHVSADGKFVYASNRGHDSIVIYAVHPDTGHLSLLAHQSTHGSGPRNFSLSPDENYLLVANQYSGNIVSFRRDENSGLLTYVTEMAAPAPVCILFQAGS